MEQTTIDCLWVLLCACLVCLMQGGFLCLETGLTRNKNNINVAIKNLADLGVSIFIFWLFGFALMFGTSFGGWLGISDFALNFNAIHFTDAVFLIYQAVFCGTAVTILSGAIAERMDFTGFILITVLIAGLIYPIYGHWAWNGLNKAEMGGFLNQMGFVDFAGSTVVHSLGGWAALAILLIIGPRTGRFPKDKTYVDINGSNIPMAALGTLFLWIGWFGFNGGSTLSLNEQVPGIIGNTFIAGSVGMLTALGISWYQTKIAKVHYAINGVLAGLVAITASVHAVSTASAAVIGAVGAIIMLLAEEWLLRKKIDDAVGAIPVHLAAGIWGTIAVALFGNPTLLGTGLTMMEQLVIQLQGILLCGIWTFGITYLLFKGIDKFYPLRVSLEDEKVGLNISEHGATTELLDLFTVMNQQSQTGDLSLRVPVEPFTQIGQIAEKYNAVLGTLETSEKQLKDSMHQLVATQGELVEAEKMAALGQLISGIAHEINTPLGTIRAAIGNIAKSYDTSIKTLPQMLETLTETEEGLFYQLIKQSEDNKEFLSSKEERKCRRALRKQLSELEVEQATSFADMLTDIGVYHSITDYLPLFQHPNATKIVEVAYRLARIQRNKDNIQLSIERASKIVFALKHYARQSHSKVMEETDLAQSIDTVLTLYQNQLKQGVEVMKNFQTIPKINCYPDELMQVWTNLIHNAIQAMKNMGKLEISLTQDSDKVAVEITDNGPGIPKDIQDSIFNPFFTTKPVGQGTGLGLSIVNKIIKKHQGTISVESQAGKTTFSVLLPI